MSGQVLTDTHSVQQGTFYLEIWGCQMNVYDGARIADLLRACGYAQVSSPNLADVVVLVTCAVREKAENKVFNQIAAWRHRQELKQDGLLALGGCVGAELAAQALDHPAGIDIVFGPSTAHRLPELIRRCKETGAGVAEVVADSLEKFSALPAPQVEGVSSFVTIMEGCSNLCSYCIVPYTRGEECSRSVEDILSECRHDLESGALELHLLGQNVNSYRGVYADGTPCDFPTLLYEVAALPGLKRLRFTTSNPMDFSDELVEAFSELPVLADSVHIPVQSGSDRILKLMNRRYSAASYRELINKLRKARPGIRISSDFIVGFPGESEEDFKATLSLAQETGFDQSFSFIYSKRPGTPAAELEDNVPLQVKRERLYLLQETLERSAAALSQALVGSIQRVLVEGPSRRDSGELKGRTSQNRIAVFKGPASLIGQECTLKITRSVVHTLRGELCEV